MYKLSSNVHVLFTDCGDQEVPGDGRRPWSQEDCTEGGQDAQEASTRASYQPHRGQWS